MASNLVLRILAQAICSGASMVVATSAPPLLPAMIQPAQVAGTLMRLEISSA